MFSMNHSCCVTVIISEIDVTKSYFKSRICHSIYFLNLDHCYELVENKWFLYLTLNYVCDTLKWNCSTIELAARLL